MPSMKTVGGIYPFTSFLKKEGKKYLKIENELQPFFNKPKKFREKKLEELIKKHNLRSLEYKSVLKSLFLNTSLYDEIKIWMYLFKRKFQLTKNKGERTWE